MEVRDLGGSLDRSGVFIPNGEMVICACRKHNSNWKLEDIF